MKNRVPILLYHSVSNEAAPRYRAFAVAPRSFSAQMAHLREVAYCPITVSEFVAVIDGSASQLPARPVVITFDDALCDFYTAALPVLQHHGFMATLYIPTTFVGQRARWLRSVGEANRAVMGWPQIAEASRSEIEIGAHGHRHVQLDTLTIAGAREQVLHSKSVLEDKLGKQVNTFSYPHGYYNSTVRQLVQEAGYRSACAVKHAMSSLEDDRWALSRIVVGAGTSVEDFAGLLQGHGIRPAPTRERVQTKVWRMVRRLAASIERGGTR